MDGPLISRYLKETECLRAPRRLLSGYGRTVVPYHLISTIDGLSGKTRIREGSVVSERPLILTAEGLRERFEGFGDGSVDFADFLSRAYESLLRVLEYRFLNKNLKTRTVNRPVREVTSAVLTSLGEADDQLVMRCPDAGWSLAIMKFTLDEALKSFPSHVRSFQEHGLFEPELAGVRRQKAQIEQLFSRAEADPAARAALGHKLKDSGLFSEYEDRFLGLFR